MSTERIVVIGAGPGGCAAAVQCQRLGVRPLLLDRCGEAGGLVRNARAIENYPGLDPISGQDFAARLTTHLERFGVPVTRGDVRRITQGDGGGFVIDRTGGGLRARQVILATGTVPATLDIPGSSDLTGTRLFYELTALRDRLPHADRVLVLGSGEAALDYALSLADQGARVDILCRGARMRARGRLPDMIADRAEIRVMYHVQPRRVRRSNGDVELDVTHADGEGSNTAAAMLVAIGRYSTVPQLLGSHAHRERDGWACAWPDLHLVGDARAGSLGQIGMAVGDGLAAAMRAVTALEQRSQET